MSKRVFEFLDKKVTDRGRSSKCQIDRWRLFSSFICDTELELWLFGPSNEISLMGHSSQTWFPFMCNICIYFTVYLRSVQSCICLFATLPCVPWNETLLMGTPVMWYVHQEGFCVFFVRQVTDRGPHSNWFAREFCDTELGLWLFASWNWIFLNIKVWRDTLGLVKPDSYSCAH